MKTRRRRIDVNLDELDEMIDRSTRVPLSASEGQQLKAALHAMAKRVAAVKLLMTDPAIKYLPAILLRHGRFEAVVEPRTFGCA